MEIYSDVSGRVPLKYECGHDSCASCVSEAGQDEHIKCPLCNMESKSPLAINSVPKYDLTTCENCRVDEYNYYCQQCKKHLCVDCNQDLHKKGEALNHTRIEVWGQQPKIDQTHICKAHPDKQISWFCESCNQCICDKCIDKSGPHRTHDFSLCSSKAETLLAESKCIISKAKEIEQETYTSLIKLEHLQYQLGSEVALVLEKPNINEKKHISNREMASSKVREHYEVIMKCAMELCRRDLDLVEKVVTTKSERWMKHTESLHKNLINLEDCDRQVEELGSKSPIDVCIQYPLLKERISNVLESWTTVDVSDDSQVPVTVFTSDILDMLKKSCFVNGPSTPIDVNLTVSEDKKGLVVSWRQGQGEGALEGTPNVHSYRIIVRILDSETKKSSCSQEYKVLNAAKDSAGGNLTPTQSLSPSSIAVTLLPDSNRLSFSVVDKAFEEQSVYAAVIAVDTNGACSGEGVSDTILGPNKMTLVSLRYVSDFDKNGVLYYIGSAGGTRAYVNPNGSGDVLATWSCPGYATFLADWFISNHFLDKHCYTKNEPNSWMMIDLGANRRLSPNYYSLRHDRHTNTFIRNWVLEGKMSEDSTDSWVVLKNHVNDTAINGVGATCSWAVTCTDQQSYRFLRIRVTGPNSNENNYLMCGGIELYGDLYIS